MSLGGDIPQPFVDLDDSPAFQTSTPAKLRAPARRPRAHSLAPRLLGPNPAGGASLLLDPSALHPGSGWLPLRIMKKQGSVAHELPEPWEQSRRPLIIEELLNEVNKAIAEWGWSRPSVDYM